MLKVRLKALSISTEAYYGILRLPHVHATLQYVWLPRQQKAGGWQLSADVRHAQDQHTDKALFAARHAAPAKQAERLLKPTSHASPISRLVG
jgi:hypothetical protein